MDPHLLVSVRQLLTTFHPQKFVRQQTNFFNTKQTNQPPGTVNHRLGMASVAVPPRAMFRSVSDLERRQTECLKRSVFLLASRVTQLPVSG